MAPLTDIDPYGGNADGVWFNRVHSYEHTTEMGGRTVHFPRSCLHCETPACVTVCPTGASYKRTSDGIVLVDEDKCIGCKLCSWACPYGAREFDTDVGVMKKCTLCVDRIYNDNIAPEDRVPACVAACPTSARHFGDLGDPEFGHLATGRRPRRRRADAGARLQADQPVPAAARPHGTRRLACLPRRSKRSRPRAGFSAGSTACYRPDRCIPPIPSSSSPRRPARATACSPCSACRQGSA